MVCIHSNSVFVTVCNSVINNLFRHGLFLSCVFCLIACIHKNVETDIYVNFEIKLYAFKIICLEKKKN